MTTPRVPVLDLRRHYRAHREEIDGAVARVLESGRYILGDELAGFEREFAAYCGVRHAVGVGSGTEALHLALRACGIGPGDEVITAANTAVPTVCAIVAAGARPRLVDNDPATYTLDPEELRALLAADRPAMRARAVIPVHLYGHPADMGPILDVAAEHGAIVIEDASQAHGAEYAGRKAGSLGAAGCFSFYPTKNLGACGDAGMVVTDSEEVAGRLRMLRNYGEEARYRNLIHGFNSRLDEIQAAILRVKLTHLDQAVGVRRDLARRYAEALAGAPLAPPAQVPPALHAFHLYVVRSEERDRLRRHLEEHGIETGVHYPSPVHEQAAYRGLGYMKGDFPEAERASREVLSLPLYPELTDEELGRVCDAIHRFK